MIDLLIVLIRNVWTAVIMFCYFPLMARENSITKEPFVM